MEDIELTLQDKTLFKNLLLLVLVEGKTNDKYKRNPLYSEMMHFRDFKLC